MNLSGLPAMCRIGLTGVAFVVLVLAGALVGERFGGVIGAQLGIGVGFALGVLAAYTVL